MSDDTTNRLQHVQAELAEILEARLSELTSAMKQTEALTRRIVSAEVELERHGSSTGALEAEIMSLDAELNSARARAAEVRSQHGALTGERERLRAEIQRLEREMREVDAEVEQSRKRAKDLESTSESLLSENNTLKAKTRTLEENVTRMRQLQKELMSSISGLTQQMATVGALGDKE